MTLRVDFFMSDLLMRKLEMQYFGDADLSDKPFPDAKVLENVIKLSREKL